MYWVNSLEVPEASIYNMGRMLDVSPNKNVYSDGIEISLVSLSNTGSVYHVD